MKMKRPLLTICLLILCFLALLFATGSITPESRWKSYIPADYSHLSVVGTLSKIDEDYLYLKEVQDYPFGFRVALPKVQRSKDYALGQILQIQGTFHTFSHATNPGEFDAFSYYSSQGLGGTLNHPVIFVINEKKSIAEGFRQLRLALTNRIYHLYPAKEASLLANLLLGDKDGLEPQIKALYQRNGIAHILSISGLHISLLGIGLYRLLRKCRMPLWCSALLAGLLMIFYGCLIGFPLPALRAIGMFLLRMLSEITGRTYDGITELTLMATILAIHNPALLSSCSFLLSFGATLGALLFFPAMQSLLRPPAEAIAYYTEKNLKNRIKTGLQKAIRSLKEAFLASFSITLFTLPIQLSFFYEVSTCGVLLNLVVLPFLSLLLPCGMLSLIPGLGFVGTVSYWILQGYEKLCLFADRLPFSVWNPGCPVVWQIVIFYVFIGFLCLWGWQKDITVPKKKSQKSPLRIVGGTILCAFCILLMAIKTLSPGTVAFLDVGQGDGMVIYTEAGEVFLIDGGSSSRKNIGRNVLKPYLKYYGLSTVDGILISHGDADHCNGSLELLENQKDWGIKVRNLLFTPQTYSASSEIVERILDTCTDKTAVTQITTGTVFQSGETIFRVLHPDAGFSGVDENAASMCLLVSFHAEDAIEKNSTSHLLLCGDVSGDGEVALTKELNRVCMAEGSSYFVLKVSHHGSAYSTSEDFLNVLNSLFPDTSPIAIISAGKNNSYGHPHRETLERLTDFSIERTDELGAITLRF